MKLHVLYFAALRERLGRSRDDLEVPVLVSSVGALRAHLVARGEPWASSFAEMKRLRVAVNQAMASDATPIDDGAEVAFFPPVTGG